MKKKKTAVASKAKSTNAALYVPHQSRFIQFGIVFIMVFAIMLMSYAVAYTLPPIK